MKITANSLIRGDCIICRMTAATSILITIVIVFRYVRSEDISKYGIPYLHRIDLTYSACGQEFSYKIADLILVTSDDTESEARRAIP